MRETVWEFKTARFTVALKIEQDYNYQYDGDDENGETQAKLDSGEYVAFDSTVTVYFDGREIGSDHLGGSVYSADNVSDFWTSHRTSAAEGRNCSMQTPTGRAYSVCQYFPSLVTVAIAEARATLCNIPKLRCA